MATLGLDLYACLKQPSDDFTLLVQAANKFNDKHWVLVRIVSTLDFKNLQHESVLDLELLASTRLAYSLVLESSLILIKALLCDYYKQRAVNLKLISIMREA